MDQHQPLRSQEGGRRLFCAGVSVQTQRGERGHQKYAVALPLVVVEEVVLLVVVVQNSELVLCRAEK